MNFFDQINQEAEQKEKEQQVKNVITNVVEAYQIARIEKGNVLLKSRRTVIDTIKVENGQVEAAKKRAIGKARMLGNCMVIEKSERVITSFYETEKDTNEEE